MVEGNLDTTNLLLGIMAAVSVLEALVIIALGVMAYKAYSKAMQIVRDVEERHVAPLMAKVNGLMATVDGVADHVRSSVAQRMLRVVGVMRGVRVAMDTLFHTGNGHNGHSRQGTRDTTTSQTAGETTHG